MWKIRFRFSRAAYTYRQAWIGPQRKNHLHQFVAVTVLAVVHRRKGFALWRGQSTRLPTNIYSSRALPIALRCATYYTSSNRCECSLKCSAQKGQRLPFRNLLISFILLKDKPFSRLIRLERRLPGLWKRSLFSAHRFLHILGKPNFYRKSHESSLKLSLQLNIRTVS